MPGFTVTGTPDVVGVRAQKRRRRGPAATESDTSLDPNAPTEQAVSDFLTRPPETVEPEPPQPQPVAAGTVTPQEPAKPVELETWRCPMCNYRVRSLHAARCTPAHARAASSLGLLQNVSSEIACTMCLSMQGAVLSPCGDGVWS
jgi:hypothetical protein